AVAGAGHPSRSASYNGLRAPSIAIRFCAIKSDCMDNVERRAPPSVYQDSARPKGVSVMSYEPPPVVDFSLPPYSRRDIAYQAAGAVLGLGLTAAGAVWLAPFWIIPPPSAPAVVGLLLAAIYMADLVSGLFHWAFDTWFDESMAPIRPSVVTVREHHIFPNRIFRVKFHHEVGPLGGKANVFRG